MPLFRFLSLIIPLSLAACAHGGGAPSAADLQGAEWVVADIAGGGIVANSRVTLNFDAEGRSGGMGSCNTYGAGYQIEGDKITFEQPFSTMMACEPALMEQERRYFDLLPQIRRFNIADDGALILSAEDGRKIIARR